MTTEPEPYHGTRAALFDFIGENMAMARVQAELGVTYASIGDAAGLEYATRRMVAYVKAIIPTVKELRPPRSETPEGSE